MTTRSPVTSWKPRRSAAPLPPFWRLEDQLERQLLGKLRQDVARAVLRAVVDDDELGADRDGQHAPDDLLDRRALVVAGHHDRQQRIGELAAAAATSSAFTFCCSSLRDGAHASATPFRRSCRDPRTAATSRARAGCARSTRTGWPGRLRAADRPCTAPAAPSPARPNRGSRAPTSAGRCPGCSTVDGRASPERVNAARMGAPRDR